MLDHRSVGFYLIQTYSSKRRARKFCIACNFDQIAKVHAIRRVKNRRSWFSRKHTKRLQSLQYSEILGAFEEPQGLQYSGIEVLLIVKMIMCWESFSFILFNSSTYIKKLITAYVFRSIMLKGAGRSQHLSLSSREIIVLIQVLAYSTTIFLVLKLNAGWWPHNEIILKSRVYKNF